MLLHEILVAAAREMPDRTALIVPGHPFRTTPAATAGDPCPGPADPPTTSWTFAALAARSRALATTVAQRTSPGARVGILAHNRAEYVAAYYGVPWAGRVLVPLNPR